MDICRKALSGADRPEQSEEMGNYGLASANEGGIGGGMFPTTEDMPARSYVTFYVQVDDLQAVEESGSKWLTSIAR